MILDSPRRIKEYTAKGYWGKKTLIDYFKEHVTEDPDRVCLVDPPNKEQLVGLAPERLTYRELDQRVDATAESLLRMGTQKDEIIIVQLPNCWELAMLYLAITRAGALISSVPMQWRESELRYIGELTQARTFITVEEFHDFKHREMGEKLQSKLPNLKHMITLQELREMGKGEITGKLDEVKIDANDIFTLCWTSGTEAEPKGCPLSHNNWIIEGTAEVELTGIRKGETLLTAGPLINMASVGTTYIPWLLVGGTFVLHHPFDPVVWMQQMIGEKVNYTLAVPALVNAIAKHPLVDKFDLSAVRSITIGGAPPALWSAREFETRWSMEIGNIWGMNEGPGIVSGAMDVPDLEKRMGGLPQYGKRGVTWNGKVFSEGIETKLLAPETGEEITEVGCVGELLYKGANVISGYFRRPDLTEKAFDKQGFFHTGDLFQIMEGNFISFVDRKKDIIIRGGFNISAQQVENILVGHPKVLDAAAVAMPDERLGEKVCVYVVPKEGEKVTLGELTSFMKEQDIAIYKLPERLEITKEIPRNPVGKMLKNILREDIKNKLKSR
jgi:acyl-CoA synthetase (AMP-forming)/AMP-acid ligase II